MTNIYLSTNGSDSNSGTADKPFASFAKAFSKLNSGDTLIASAGTYKNGLPAVLQSKTNVTIQANGAVWDFGNNPRYTGDSRVVWFNDCANISLKGLRVKNAQCRGIRFDGSKNIAIEDCHVSEIGRQGISLLNCDGAEVKNSSAHRCVLINPPTGTTGAAFQIKYTSNFYVDGFTCSESRVDGIMATFVHDGAYVNCVAYDNKTTNIYLEQSYNVTIDQGHFYGTPGGENTALNCSIKQEQPRVKTRNITISNCKIEGKHCGNNLVLNLGKPSTLPSGMDGIQILNNIIEGGNTVITWGNDAQYAKNSIFSGNIVRKGAESGKLIAVARGDCSGVTFDNNVWSHMPEMRCAFGTNSVIGDVPNPEPPDPPEPEPEPESPVPVDEWEILFSTGEPNLATDGELYRLEYTEDEDAWFGTTVEAPVTLYIRASSTAQANVQLWQHEQRLMAHVVKATDFGFDELTFSDFEGQAQLQLRIWAGSGIVEWSLSDPLAEPEPEPEPDPPIYVEGEFQGVSVAGWHIGDVFVLEIV